MKAPLALALGIGLALPAAAHEGEDHGAPPPAATQNLSPRASAATEDFELVAVLEAQRLVVYLDRYASNEPVAKATVDIEGPGLSGTAREIAEGVYELPVAAALPPGKHALTFTVETAEAADLLSASLDLSAPAAGVKHTHDWGEWAVWGASGGFLFAGLGLIAVRRRRVAKAKGS